MFWKSNVVGARIAWTAAAIGDEKLFGERAKTVATEIGPKFNRKAKAYFWGPPKKPEDLRGRHEGLGEWMAACQAAIFEVAYHLREASLPFLRSVAFGIYDWTQANATDALCRLACEGLETQRVAEEVAKHLKQWRYEQIMRVCGRVAELSVHSAELRAALDSLVQEWRTSDPIDAFEIVAAMAHADRRYALEHYQDFLRGLAQGVGLEGRTAFDDGQVVPTPDGKGIVAKSGPTYPSTQDFHRIQAAVLLFKLEPTHTDVRRQLESWAETHPDEQRRTELRRILSARA